MEENNRRGILITHQHCLDGATAALIGIQCGLRPLFCEPDRVTDAIDGLAGDASIYLADVSIPVIKWTSYRSKITHVLDHHQTALPLRDDPKATIDMSRSGAHLMYSFAVQQGWMKASQEWDRLISTVEHYDLWRPHHLEGQDLNRLFYARGFSWYQQRFPSGWSPLTPDEASQLAAVILEERTFISTHLDAAHIRTIGSFRVAGIYLETEGPVNEVAHALLAGGCDLVVFVKSDGRLSARSSPKVDAARLMEVHFLGGGHARAAGGRLPESLSISPLTVDLVLNKIESALTDAQR